MNICGLVASKREGERECLVVADSRGVSKKKREREIERVKKLLHNLLLKIWYKLCERISKNYYVFIIIAHT